jgi:hypothetical protein
LLPAFSETAILLPQEIGNMREKYGLEATGFVLKRGVNRQGMAFRGFLICLAASSAVFAAGFYAGAVVEIKPDKGKPVAYLRIIFNDPHASVSSTNYRAKFDIFRSTQKALMLTPAVLRAAAKNPKIADLPPVKEHKNIEQWLRNRLRIEFPDDAEVMKVCIEGADAKDGVMLVNAVVEAYMSEIVEAEQNKIQARIRELNDTIVKKKDLLNSSLYDLRRITSQFNNPDFEMLTLQQKNVLEELALVRTAFIRAEYKLIEMKTELASKEALLRAAVETPITDVECLEFTDSDSILKKLGEELATRKVAEDEKSKADLERVQTLYNERIERIRGEIAAKKRADLDKEVKSLQAAVAVAKQPPFAEAEVKRLREEAERFTFGFVDIPMFRDQVKNMEKTVDALVSEMNALLIESKTMPRIVVLSFAEIPE